MDPVVGIVGGGQLARMMHQASIALGIRIRLLRETADSSAAQVVHDVVVGDHDDLETLRSLRPRLRRHHVRPRARADRPPAGARGRRRRRTARAGCPGARPGQARHAARGSPQPGCRARAGRRSRGRPSSTRSPPRSGWPAVLKTPRGGYDGKGVRWSDPAPMLRTGSARLAPDGPGLLAEERVAFTRELAALVARRPSGQAVAYPVVETVQGDGVCREVVAPAPGLSDDARGRRPGRRRSASPASSASSGCSPSSSSTTPDGASSSTSSRCARTTAATGRSTAR